MCSFLFVLRIPLCNTVHVVDGDSRYEEDMKMEKVLQKLMDYQKMEQAPRLAKMIKGTESRFAAMLSDDDLAFVNAAGTGSGEFQFQPREKRLSDD